MSRVWQVATTVDAEPAAKALAESAVHARLAACAQVSGPITSTYRWQGTVETATEWVVTFKTTAEVAPALTSHIRERHSYDQPEIIATEVVGGDPGYLAWVVTETR
ncbi:MAG TPA: divalent-cation tolerance protein CutA [Micromonosporaceae bacterium]